jgi:bidirectional [NiFe] hydrogenase diaphorase subunit
MIITSAKPKVPSADARWKLVEATMRRHGSQSDALIETLHTVQESFGYLDETSLKFVALSLHVPFSRVYGVATFYHLFTMRPPGEHTCVVCLGTACYIRGAQAIIDRIGQTLKVKPGETTPDGKISFLTARCLGSCGLAPAVVFDGAVAGKQSPENALERVQKMVSEPKRVEP